MEPEKGSQREGKRTGDGQCHREASSGINSARCCLDMDDGAEAQGSLDHLQKGTSGEWWES